VSVSTLALLGGAPVRTAPFPPYPIIGEEEIRSVVAVLQSGCLSTFHSHFLGGERVRRFEEDFARYHGVRHAVACNSGTAALHMAVAAAGIGPGDEVIVPPYTFTATATAVLHGNGVPVFADVRDDGTLDPDAVARVISPRTKAVIPVHLAGAAADLAPILALAERHRLAVIEDAAQAPGARYQGKLVGTFGSLATYSFQETKNMMTGEGGMVITDDDALAERARAVRNHGESIAWGKKREYLSNLLGWNYRMPEMEAALGICQLKHLDEWNERRAANADVLTKGMSGLPFLSTPTVRHGDRHVFHMYALRYDARSAGVPKTLLLKALEAEGIPVSGGYPRPIYDNPLFQEQIGYGSQGCPFRCPLYQGTANYAKGSCPVAERLCADEAVWLFLVRPPAGESDMTDVVTAFRKVIGQIDRLRSIAIAKDAP
jgi:dTDP-4-amino-4,6-dideoxygalactose transaminase